MAIKFGRRALLSLALVGMAACQSAPPTTPTPTAFALSGTVTLSAPSFLPLSGAVVAVVDGPFAGRSATSDSNGEFRLHGLSGSINLRASGPGYGSQTISVDMTEARNIRLTLRPEPEILEITETKQGTALGACDAPCRIYVLNIHNDGAVEAQVTWPLATGALKLSLWLGDTMIVNSFRANTNRQFLSAPVTGGYAYQLRVTGDGTGDIPDFQLFIRRPN